MMIPVQFISVARITDLLSDNFIRLQKQRLNHDTVIIIGFVTERHKIIRNLARILK